MSKSIQKYINEEDKNMLLLFIVIIVLIWLLYYFIPSLFASLFKTFLGNVILFIILVFVSVNNYKIGILLFILFIFLSRFEFFSRNYNYNYKEGFFWDNKTTTDFLSVQNTINRNKIFVVDDIKKQASQKEAEYLIKNSEWPWSNETEQLYKASILNNPFIQTYNKDSIIDAKRTYNNKVILDILSNQTKEGRFLSTGVEVHTGKNMMADGVGYFGYNSGLIKNLYNPTIKCHPKYPNSNEYVLKSEEYIGDDGITGEHVIVTKDVDINNLENIIPGFTFLDKPCNPCSALAYNNDPKYNCPFSLNVKNTNTGISAVWEYLWSIDKDPINKRNLNSKRDITGEVNANTFKLPPFNY